MSPGDRACDAWSLRLRLLPGTYAICRLEPTAPVPAWARAGRFSSVTRTVAELSVVCAAAAVPTGVRSEPGWRVLAVEGRVGAPDEKSPVGAPDEKSPVGAPDEKSPVGAPDEKSPVEAPDEKSPVGAPDEKSLDRNAPLDLGLVGILAALLDPLAQAAVPVFTISTFDTDHLLVKQDRLAAARRALERAGHEVGAEAE